MALTRITSDGITDGSIVNADINASAAIDGTKISPVFGSQTITTSGQVAASDIAVSGTAPVVSFTDTNANSDFKVEVDGGVFKIKDITNSNATRVKVESDGTTNVLGNLDVGAGIDVTGSVNATTDITLASTTSGQKISITKDGTEAARLGHIGTGNEGLLVLKDGGTDTVKLNGDAPSGVSYFNAGNVGIGTTSPAVKFVVSNGGAEGLEVSHSSGNVELNAYNRSTSARSPVGIVGQTFTVTTGNPTLNTGLFQNSSGNVGIGTTSPDTLLHLSGADTAVIRLENTDTTLGNDQIIGGIEFEKQDSTGAGVGIAGAVRLKSMSSVGQAASMFFSTSNSGGNDQTRMTLNFDGNLGIGTTSPSYKLHLTRTDAAGDYAYFGASSDGGQRGLEFTSSDTGIYLGAVHTINASSGGGILAFATASSERMRIDSSGNALIGRTSTINGNQNTSTGTHINSNGLFQCAVDGDTCLALQRLNSNGSIIQFRRNTTFVGGIEVTTSSTAYNTSGSDRTLKKNFELWNENVLDLFKSINPQKFNFIQEDDGAEKSKGFVAQDMVSSFPEAYTKGEEEDSKYFFNPSGMVVYLMKALQEAVARIEALEAK